VEGLDASVEGTPKNTRFASAAGIQCCGLVEKFLGKPAIAAKPPKSEQHFNMKQQTGPLTDLPKREREIMARLLRMSPELQRDSPKPLTPKGIAQRRRRENERKERPASKGRVHKGKSRA
jgi:hypothetical protein